MSSFKLTALCSALISSGVMATDKPTQKDENQIEKLVITATPFGRTILESTTPVSVLAGEELQQNLAPTLGETLKNIPGVNSSYYGPVSSPPIIRGLNGPRIKIVQNGLDSSDASRVGPDHVVSAEASTATQIEVMRGPATLLYGSGAIGGVVNIVNNRLPRETQDGVSGDVMALHNTVSNENTFSGNVDGGSGDIAWHVDGFTRKTDDYEIPRPAVKGSDDNSGTLTN
ncbi:MAG: iron complex outermembrane receptor protein [Paraglaciecola sp.]|jgi:iron complex outermembrane receptor protein